MNYIYACMETKRAYLVQGRSWCTGIYFQAQLGYWLKPVTGSGAGMKLVLGDEAGGWRRPGWNNWSHCWAAASANTCSYGRKTKVAPLEEKKLETERRDTGDGEGVLVGLSVFSSVYLLSFYSSFLSFASILSLLRRNGCCCCGTRWRPVWG